MSSPSYIADIEHLTEDELAALLGITTRSVRRLHKQSGLPALSEGRSRQYQWSTIREWYLLYRLRIARNGGKQSGEMGRVLRAMVIQTSASAKRRFGSPGERTRKAVLTVLSDPKPREPRSVRMRKPRRVVLSD